LNPKEKFIIRSSILELAETGAPRNISIDEKIGMDHKERENERISNIWDCITALGAQLSRPPYDPYREIINLGISVGRRQCPTKVILSMPLVIYDNGSMIEDTTLESLHAALNWLAANDNTILGLVSENRTKNDRKYPHFERINEKSTMEDDNQPEGLVLQYNNDKSLQFITDLRKQFSGPILVEVDDGFEKYMGSLLDVGVDAVIADTIKLTNREKYKGKHATAVIYDVRCAINQYYAGKENDGALLLVAGDLNNTGRIVKAAALGADIIGYSTSLLIANAANHYENSSNVNAIPERICRHIQATKGELKGVPAALGYSDFYNISPADLRTSSIEASLQADIALEGVDKTYREIMEESTIGKTIAEGMRFDKDGKRDLHQKHSCIFTDK
jgi:hypothetical protein